MKLLLCTSCRDVVRLRPQHRTCFCGESSGFYADEHIVEVEGPSVVIAIDSALIHGTKRNGKARVLHEPTRVIQRYGLPLAEALERHRALGRLPS